MFEHVGVELPLRNVRCLPKRTGRGLLKHPLGCHLVAQLKPVDAAPERPLVVAESPGLYTVQ